MIIVYMYRNCSTCRKAIAWLNEKGIAFDERAIREMPPTKEELRQVLSAYDGNVRRLFNTSGQDYRELNLKECLPEMTTDEAIELLSENGNLVKRPFLLADSSGWAGFNEEDWQRLLGKG